MEQLYLWCAVGAGSLFAVQTILTLVGIGSTELDLDVGDVDLDIGDIDLDGGDIEHPVGADAHFIGMLSLKAMIAGTTVFGLTGLAAGKHLNAGRTVLIAMTAAACTMYAVGWLIHKMHQLNADGTVQISECLGTVGSVYLTIPANKVGVGKVTVVIQGRTMEYSAVTEGNALPTGTQITVSGLLNSETLIVQSVT